MAGQREAEIRALQTAIETNDHEMIRQLHRQNPGIRYDDEFQDRVVCPCGCQGYADFPSSPTEALLSEDVTIATCRVMLDLGIFGLQDGNFILRFTMGCDNAGAVRNLFRMCEWYDPARLAQVRSRAGATLIRASLDCKIGEWSDDLRPAYIQWLNMLLRAGCPLQTGAAPSDEADLALLSLQLDDTGNRVVDSNAHMFRT